MKQLLTMQDFYDAIIGGEGYIVITDAARPTLAHPPHCSSLQGEHFKEKVVKNRGKLGGYFWVETMREARERFEAAPCACGW